jgi:hypothetical protein
MTMSKEKRLFLSMVIAGSLTAFPFLVDRVPVFRRFGDLADFLWLPGALLASPVFPQGGHSGGGVANYAYLVGLLNLGIYGGLTFLLLTFGGWPRRRLTR